MKRWNDYYDKMDPKKKDPKKSAPIDVTRSASVKYFSVYPRKANHHHTEQNTTAENQSQRSQHKQPSAETSFQGERYISRQHEFGTISNRVDAGHTNYAWVDWNLNWKIR